MSSLLDLTDGRDERTGSEAGGHVGRGFTEPHNYRCIRNQAGPKWLTGKLEFADKGTTLQGSGEEMASCHPCYTSRNRVLLQEDERARTKSNHPAWC